MYAVERKMTKKMFTVLGLNLKKKSERQIKLKLQAKFI
jgi:hypothetical protein